MLSQLIVNAGRSLVGIFLPLLLMNGGLSLWQVCAFYVGYALMKLCVNYPVMKLINRRGARIGLIMAYMMSGLFMTMLTMFSLTGSLIFVGVMTIVMALQNSFQWNSEHLHIARVMDSSRKSRDLAMISNLDRVIGIFVPVIGGVITVAFGPVWLTIVATIVVLIAILPVWNMDKLAGGHQPDANLKYNLRGAPMRDIVANGAFNFHTAVGVMVWPIYLAVFIPNFQTIGVVTSIATAATVIVLHFTAKRSDKGKSFRVLTEGTAMSSIVHLGRVLASSNPVSITIVSSFYKIALAYQGNPWTSLYYAHTKEGGIRYIMSMEIAGDLAYVVLWGGLGTIAYITHSSIFFTVAFIAAAIAAWGCLFIRPEKTHPKP